MNTKKLLAGFIVALLLAVTSAAAACDVSCAFALASADCHSSNEASAGTSMSAADMGSMDMSGTAMPGVNQGQTKAPDTQISRANAPHPSIGDMGPCEQQSCDKAAFVFAKGQRWQPRSVSPVALRAATTIPGNSPQVFRDARDDVAPFSSFTANLPTLTLRI